MLKDDHRSVEKLFKRFEDAGDRAFVEKRKVVDRIIEELSVHAAVEEQLFYPVTRATVPAVGGRGPREPRGAPHRQVGAVRARGLDPEAERFDAKVTVLIENVRHHVEEEESEYFPAVRDELGRKALTELGDAMASAKKTAPTAPAPPLARHAAGQPRRRHGRRRGRQGRRDGVGPGPGRRDRRAGSHRSHPGQPHAAPSLVDRVEHRSPYGAERSGPGRARRWTGWWRPCRPPSPAARTSSAPSSRARPAQVAPRPRVPSPSPTTSGPAPPRPRTPPPAAPARRPAMPAAGPSTRPGRHGRPCARQAAPHEPAPARRDGPPRAPRRHRRRRPPRAPRRPGEGARQGRLVAAVEGALQGLVARLRPPVGRRGPARPADPPADSPPRPARAVTLAGHGRRPVLG